jgi:hypothetical protein
MKPRRHMLGCEPDTDGIVVIVLALIADRRNLFA